MTVFPMKAVFFLALVLALVAACAGRTSSSAGSGKDAADESILVDASDDLESAANDVDAAMDGSGLFCLIPVGDGYFQCPADRMTVCPDGDGCNICVCYPTIDGPPAAECTTHVCPDG